MMLVFVAAFAVGVSLPSAADHPATETHVEADHGGHDGHIVTVDQRAVSRAAGHALPAPAPRLIAGSEEVAAAAPDAPARLPGYPPPKPAPARSPPHSA